MILGFGGFKHPRGSVSVQIAKKNLTTPSGMTHAEEHTWTIEGWLTTADTGAVTETQCRQAIKLKTSQLENAYSQDGKDLRLFFPDGTTLTHHVLLNDNCMGGVRIVEPPSYPEGKSVEGITKRQFRIVLMGTIPIPSSRLPTALKSFEETLEFEPAGARFGHLETKVGRAVKQQLRRHQTFRAVQRGSAVGLYRRPSFIPDPIFPYALVHERPLIRKQSPAAHFNSANEDYADFGIQWEWLYESAFELNGEPNYWMF